MSYKTLVISLSVLTVLALIAVWYLLSPATTSVIQNTTSNTATTPSSGNSGGVQTSNTAQTSGSVQNSNNSQTSGGVQTSSGIQNSNTIQNTVGVQGSKTYQTSSGVQNSNTYQTSGGTQNYVTPISGNTTNLVPGGSVAGQGNTPSGTTGLTQQNISGSYATLLSEFSGHELSFVDVNSTTDKNFGDIYTLYKQDLVASSKMNPSLKTISVASVDIDGDGNPEAIVYEGLPYSCGSGGCRMDVYKKVKGAWITMLETLAYKQVGMLDSKNKGVNDLVFSVHCDIGYQTKIIEYSWDGSAYQLKGVIATWTGSDFKLGE